MESDGGGRGGGDCGCVDREVGRSSPPMQEMGLK